MKFRLLCILLLVLTAPLSADELKTLGGKGVNGALAALNDKDITLKTEAGPVATPLAQVLALDIRPIKGIPAGAKYISVRLIDDTVLYCKDIAFGPKEAQATLLSGVALKIPVQFLLSFVREAQDPDLAKKWAKLSKDKLRLDRIVILDKGELNPLDGALGAIDKEGKTIEFKAETIGLKPLPLDRLHGVIFFRNEVLGETPTCKVIDLEGNSLAATKASFDGTSLNLTTAFGAKVAFKYEHLAKLDFNIGKLTFLSDLEPSKVVERSGIGLITRYKKDSNLDGEPIILEKPHPKGISVHAYTELEYNLAGKYKEFKCLLGIDTRVGADSQPLVTIYCDGEKRLTQVVTAKTTVPVALNVKDATTLKIVVSSRNILDLHDHVTLADARVSQ